MASLWAVVFGWLSVVRHLAGGTHAEDLGFTDQVIANFLRGQWFRMTIYEGATWNTELDISRIARPDSLLAFHFEPMLLLFVPLYALGGGATLLLILQAGAIAAGAIPAYRLGRHATASSFAGVAVVLAYLLSPFGQWAALADFHTSTLAAPLLLLAVERLVVAQSPRQAVLVAGMAALAREDVGIVVAALGAMQLLRGAERRPALALIGIGVGCTVVGLVLMRAYNGQALPFNGRYGTTLGAGLAGTLDAVFRPGVRGYVTTLALSGGWLGVLAPVAFVPMLPTIALNALASSPWMMAGKAHYSGLVLPFVAVAAAAGLRRLREPSWLLPAGAAALVLTSLVGYALEGAGPLGGNYAPASITPHAQQAAALAASLPSDAAVSASASLVPRLSHRAHIYTFPAIEGAEYVFLDVRASPAPTSAGDVFLRARALLSQGGWEVVHASDGLLLLRSVDAAGPTDIADVTTQLLADAHPDPLTGPLGTYADGRVSLLSADLVPSPDGATEVDGPRWILRTVWRAEAPLSDAARLAFTIVLRDGRQLHVWDTADLWWNPPGRWTVGRPVTVDIPDIPPRQFVFWQADWSDE